MNCKCAHPQLTQRPEGMWCAACSRPVKERGEPISARKPPGRATIPPEKADALREIHNLRREFNAKLDRLKAEILKT